MKDFYSFDEFSIPYGISVLFWGLYIAVFAFTAWKMLLSSDTYKQRKEVTGWFGVFFALYAVFYCINPDYFRYRDWINITDIDLWTKEKFYIYTILFCRSLPFSYPFEVFRLIVWGGGVLIVYQTFRLYRDALLPGLALLILFVLHAGAFSYARASLAMAVYFLGIALYLVHNKMVLKLLGIGIAFISYYFHREMLIGIAVLPCLFIPLEKKNVTIFSLFLLLTAIVAISYVSSYIEFLDAMFDNDDISSKIEHFNEKEQRVFRLSTFIGYLKYFYPIYLLTKSFWKRKAPDPVIGMYRISYGIMMASVAFMIVFGLRSIYAYRTLYISMIPESLMISYGYYHGYFTRKQLWMMMTLALLSNSVRFINAE